MDIVKAILTAFIPESATAIPAIFALLTAPTAIPVAIPTGAATIPAKKNATDANGNRATLLAIVIDDESGFNIDSENLT